MFHLPRTLGLCLQVILKAARGLLEPVPEGTPGAAGIQSIGLLPSGPLLAWAWMNGLEFNFVPEKRLAWPQFQPLDRSRVGRSVLQLLHWLCDILRVDVARRCT